MTKQELIQQHNQNVKDIIYQEMKKNIFTIFIGVSIGYVAIHIAVYILRVHYGLL